MLHVEPLIHLGEPAIDLLSVTLRTPIPAAPGGRLHVDRVGDLAGFAGLCREWDALLERSGERSPFLTWEWLYPWWKHLGHGADLYLLTVRDVLGRLVGLAPLFRSRIALGGGARRLEFLGTGKVASDYLNLIVDPVEGSGVVAVLVEYLVAHREEWEVLSLTDVDGEAWTLSMVRALFRTQGFDADISLEPGFSCPFARLDGGWEPYLQSRSNRMRRQIKQNGAFLVERYGARFQAVDRATDLPRAIESLITLHRARRAAVGETTAFEDESVLAFLRETTPLLQERGWLRLYALVVGERPVAVEYGLAYRGTFFDYQKGFDLEASKWGAGTVLQGLSVQHACGEGMTEFDFLRGDESYKDRWAPYARQTKRLDIVQRSPRTMFFRGRRGLIRCFRDARRRVRAMIGSP